MIQDLTHRLECLHITKPGHCAYEKLGYRGGSRPVNANDPSLICWGGCEPVGAIEDICKEAVLAVCRKGLYVERKRRSGCRVSIHYTTRYRPERKTSGQRIRPRALYVLRAESRRPSSSSTSVYDAILPLSGGANVESSNSPATWKRQTRMSR